MGQGREPHRLADAIAGFGREPYLAAMTEIATIAGTKVLFAAADGPPLDATTANDLLGEAWGVEADLVAVPVARLAEGFLLSLIHI